MTDFKLILIVSIILGISLSLATSGVTKKEYPTIQTEITQNEDNDTFQNKLISLAKSKLGSPYVYAKTGPDSFDCSGFIYYLFESHEIQIPRTSLAQSKIGEQLSRMQIQKGDLLFFDTSTKGKGHVNHTGVYLGDNKFIHASSGKANGVTISDLNGWYKDKFKWGIRKLH